MPAFEAAVPKCARFRAVLLKYISALGTAVHMPAVIHKELRIDFYRPINKTVKNLSTIHYTLFSYFLQEQLQFFSSKKSEMEGISLL